MFHNSYYRFLGIAEGTYRYSVSQGREGRKAGKKGKEDLMCCKLIHCIYITTITYFLEINKSIKNYEIIIFKRKEYKTVFFS